MHRNRQGIAEPEGASEQQRRMGAEKVQRDVRPPRCLQHQNREKREQRGKPDAGAPLTRRNPDVMGAEE